MNRRTRSSLLAAAMGCAALSLATTPASAIGLLDGFSGDSTYGTLAMSRNDDDSSNELSLPFAINFFGNTYNSFYVNNNGNVTFNGPVGTFTPNPFPISNQPMIAPYWGDVDTRCSTCGAVYVAEGQTNSPNDTVVVTWNDVGYYRLHSDKTNNFQLVLRDRSDTGAGNFDIDFRYDRLEWTTGDASGGNNGLGGTPAQAGFDAGDRAHFFTAPGSRTDQVLDLATTSNVSGATPGLWTFAVRNGELPGSSPSNPLLPVNTNDGFVFDFNVDLNQRIFIDPPVAVGYTYAVQSGPNFASVSLPNVGDGLFDLYINNSFVDQLTAGNEYFFAPGGVSSFEIRGIETAAALDPNDPTAFVTSLSFVSAGQVSMTQTPIVFDTTPGSNAPVPGSLLLLLAGLGGFSATRRIARTAH